MLGMLAAVETWVKRDHDGEWKTWLSWLDTISRRVTTVDGVTTEVRERTGLSNRSPSLVISWDPGKLHITGADLADELARTKPRIAVGAGGGGEAKPDPAVTSISVTAWMMQPGDDKIAAERIRSLLVQKRSPQSTRVAAPAADFSGRWNVQIEFFSSTSQHTLFIEQDGNWVEGPSDD